MVEDSANDTPAPAAPPDTPEDDAGPAKPSPDADAESRDRDEQAGDAPGQTDLRDEAGEPIEAQTVVEAILFATDSPLPARRIAQVMGVGDGRSVRKHIGELNARYKQDGAAYRIEEIAGGFQMLTLPRYNTWLAKLNRVKQQSRLSPAALETLAIVAYKQPVLRAEVEAIRGVAVGDVLNRLREMNLVKITGRDEQIGRPLLYGTTRRFLQVFGLSSLRDLPKVEELKPPE